MLIDVNVQYEPVLGDGLASCRPSETLLMLPDLFPVPSWACCCCGSSCFSSMFPIRAFLMMSSRPRLLAGSLNEWFLGFTLPVKDKTNIHAHIGNTENQFKKCLNYNINKHMKIHQMMQVLIFYGEINHADDVVKLTWCCYCWEIEDLCAWLSITCWDKEQMGVRIRC